MTGDVLRTLVLATHLLGVNRVLVVEHTECKMASATEEQVHEQIRTEFGIDTRSLDFQLMDDQLASLREGRAAGPQLALPAEGRRGRPGSCSTSAPACCARSAEPLLGPRGQAAPAEDAPSSARPPSSASAA